MNALETADYLPHSEIGVKDSHRSGTLIINADDWGLNRETTDCIHACVRYKTVSSASAMVFMEDSVRASELAREEAIHTGLHLNLTEPFSAPSVAGLLAEHHAKVASYLRRRRANQAFFHPGLMRSFDYTVQAQLEEYSRLYGAPPMRLDGHHHMHLCANVLFGGLMPTGTFVRRNFSFRPGEKRFANRWYRQFIDRILARHHRLTDFFFALAPVDSPDRLTRIFSLSQSSSVEVETHPAVQEEYYLLTSDKFATWVSGLPLTETLPKGAASVQGR
jgi:predicted glycoside hydrolase/deacetylase ChbG (UPF0249 family)